MIYKVFLPLLRKKIRRDVPLSHPNTGPVGIVSLVDKITARGDWTKTRDGNGDWGRAICINRNRPLIQAPQTDQGHSRCVCTTNIINTLPTTSILSRLPKTRNYDTDRTRGLRSSPYAGIYSVVLAQGSFKDSPQPSNNQGLTICCRCGGCWKRNRGCFCSLESASRCPG